MVNKITSPITPLEEVAKINEIIDGKQDTLVSGTNIKTVNSSSLLGSGDIAVGTVTSVNNVSPVNGNVSLSIPTVDQTYNATSANAQSGIAIAGAGFLKNTATGSNALTIGGTASAATSALNIGATSTAGGGYSVAVGYYAASNGARTTSIGYGARIGGSTADAIQIGNGTNSTAKSLSIGFYNTGNYQLLDGTTGLIPSDRIPIDNSTITVNSSGQLIASGGSGGSSRNIGEIIQSTIPLSDAGLHLLDGSVISGSGSYSAFVTHIAGLVSGHSELFTTEANWQTSNDNYGACDKFVYDSTNNTVRLPKRVTDHGVLIKSYSSGTDWYRIYSDGWCEQGGYVAADSTGGQKTVTLLKAFTNTNYNVTLGTYRTANLSDGYAYYLGSVGVKTTGTFGFWIDSTSYLTGCHWKACGYIDISDLQQTPVYEYIVVANSVKTPVEVDIDEVMTDLNGKVDIADLDTCHVVVETYHNGASWYRVYDDGWCEQGGVVQAVTGAAWNTISVSFSKAYIDTNYSISMACAITMNSTPNTYTHCNIISPITTNSVTFNFYASDVSARIWWRTAGYIR